MKVSQGISDLPTFLPTLTDSKVEARVVANVDGRTYGWIPISHYETKRMHSNGILRALNLIQWQFNKLY